MMTTRKGYLKDLFYDLFFQTDIRCWRHVGEILNMIKVYRKEAGLFLATIKALAGWTHYPRKKGK